MKCKWTVCLPPSSLPLAAFALWIALGLALVPAQTSAQQTKREITRIAGEVYRFRNNFHYSVFAVTPQGIIATDPINAEAAAWLKGELKRRFNQPVRYLIYSHDHVDHVAGGEVFAETAVIVAHHKAKKVIIGEKRPAPWKISPFSRRLILRFITAG